MKTGMFPEGRVQIRVNVTIVVSGVKRWGAECVRDIPSTMDEAQGVSYLTFWGTHAAINAVGDATREATLAMRNAEIVQ